MNLHRIAAVAAPSLLWLALCFPSWAEAPEDEIAELKRTVKELQAQNRKLSKRVSSLESTKSEPAQERARRGPVKTVRRELPPPPLDPVAEEALPKPIQPAKVATPPVETEHTEQLERRVTELEMAKTAQEDATRSIIRDAFSKLGPNINEFLALGGSLEVLASRFKDYTGHPTDQLSLNTAELDFDIKANDWTFGSLILEYNPGTNILFPTTEGFSTGVDRITVQRGTITIGDTQRFPLYIKGGLDTLEFGTSTGVHRLDVLSIGTPTTIEGFEILRPEVGLGFAFPTPPLSRPGPAVTVPPVRPQVIAPVVKSLAEAFGYAPPPTKPKPQRPLTPVPTPPPIYGSVYVYEGDSAIAATRNLIQNVNATLGFRAGGHCGRPYDQLRLEDYCPWSLDFHVDYNTSVFDSVFLQEGYRSFLRQIGYISGMAASAKMSFGPVSLVAELNGAIDRATFVDGLGKTVNITPAAWQLAFGYQFDWNPWVEAIGEQGDFIAIGYSGTSGLAGATALINNQPTRVGFLPKTRLLVTFGEWVLDNLKWSIEFAANWDYSVSQGGTGKFATGVFTNLTYNF
jgi:uncharacterized coiled-coil protein SlyX